MSRAVITLMRVRAMLAAARRWPAVIWLRVRISAAEMDLAMLETNLLMVPEQIRLHRESIARWREQLQDLGHRS